MFEPIAGGLSIDSASCVCIGAGRFLRAVLVPALREAGESVIIAQPRGTSFGEYMAKRAPANTYEVDCVAVDGSIATTEQVIVAVGSLGNDAGKAAFMALPPQLPRLRVIGVGVTEAGVAMDSGSMLHLAEFLHQCMQAKSDRDWKLAVINTDNVPDNGDKIEGFVKGGSYVAGLPVADGAAFVAWLDGSVSFINSMVDRIVAAREGESEVPRAEPLPAKALVLEDLFSVLPPQLGSCKGVVIRTRGGAIDRDHCLKLRILNAVHSAIVYLGALTPALRNTDSCVAHPAVLPYCEHLFEEDISTIGDELSMPRADVEAIFREWLARLQHPSFGLDCFWVTQNASQKLGIRFIPTVLAVLEQTARRPSQWMAFAIAAMLRFLTPHGSQPRAMDGVFAGRMDVEQKAKRARSESAEYVRGLSANAGEGSYEFKDGDGRTPQLLQRIGTNTASHAEVVAVLAEVLAPVPGFDAGLPAHSELAGRVATLLHRMVSGGEAALDVLLSLSPEAPVMVPTEKIADIVNMEVQAVQAIDLHTHLFPPQHGDLMLWGIDEMLTYHYLVAEYFITAEQDPDDFFALPKSAQADLIWNALFIERAPISEACRGIVTTMRLLGLGDALERRDLAAMRAWFKDQDPDAHVDAVFKAAGLRYVVMTNIPFDPNEARHWKEKRVYNKSKFRSALRIDALFLGDWTVVRAALKESGHEESLEGARTYLREWAKLMEPEYLMASTPHDYAYEPSDGSGADKTGEPNAATLLEEVVIPIAVELDLPIAMKLGAHRAVNPPLRFGGDGVVREGGGSVQVLRSLVVTFPKVKWLATFLSRVNQHEACVLANKFGNLHLYGCWWYCNNPSIIEEMTAMRMELLGTAFTCQHSDSRVLDQLVYKWVHSRSVISPIIARKFLELVEAGWSVSRAQIKHEVHMLFGGSYEHFMAKTLAASS